MSKSCAEIATGWQGTENFPGHDIYQNGIIRDDCTRIYMAGWQNDWARATYIDDKGIEHLAASGYFTDQATIDSCMNGEKLNTNELDSALQTKLSDFSTSTYENGNKIQGNFQAHSNVSAYDIDHKRLAELKTEDSNLYNRLTNPDGLSPNGEGIKVAYGQAEANPQHGSGGGNQYYIDPQTFKDAENAGVFNYNQGASFSTDRSTGREIERNDISAKEYGAFDDGKYNNDLVEAIQADKKRMTSIADERERSGQSEEDRINSQCALENPSKPYVTYSDPAYRINYGRNDEEAEGQDNREATEKSGDQNNTEKNEAVESQNLSADSTVDQEGEKEENQNEMEEGQNASEESGEDDASNALNTAKGDKEEENQNTTGESQSPTEENETENNQNSAAKGTEDNDQENSDNNVKNGEYGENAVQGMPNDSENAQETAGQGENMSEEMPTKSGEDQSNGEWEGNASEKMPTESEESPEAGGQKADTSEGMPNESGGDRENGGEDGNTSEGMPTNSGEDQGSGQMAAGASEGMPSDSGAAGSSEAQAPTTPSQSDGMGM